MEASGFREAVFQIHRQGRERGHYFLMAEDERLSGRSMQIDGRRLLSFGSCSYLGLEFDPRLVEGAVEAYRRYGSQTSYSRGYLSCPLYRELEEDLLPRIFGVEQVLLLPSTSAAHHVMMPALVTERDAVVCDHQVHRSVDDAITLQCARSNAKKLVLKHGELDRALDTVSALARRHHTVWLACDGVYSMYGDYLPADFLRAVLAVAPNVRLYIDDAHGMSWAGLHGRGHCLSRLELDERVVVVTSLAKAFATGGGVVVARDRRLLETARLVGGPYSFSGPLRPGDLGASVASARIHLGPELPPLQRALRARVELANALCRKLGIPLVIENEAPILFVALGRAEAVFSMAERLRDEGFHVNVSGFPAVPSSRGGLRVAINTIHTEAEVTALFEAIARHLPSVLAAAGVTRDEVDEQFRDVLPSFLRQKAHLPVPALPVADATITAPQRAFEVASYRSIDDLDVASWDSLLASAAYIDASSMRAAERVFHAEHPQPEHRWGFRYAILRDREGIAAAAPFTTCLLKDDAFMSAEVSQALERERLRDPYHFTSRAVVLGTMLSEGLHMYLRPGPQRLAALVRLVEVGVEEMKAQGATTLVFRDLPEDPELGKVLAGQGLVPMPLLDSHVVDLDWKGEDAFIAQIPGRKRRHVRATHEQSAHFTVETWDATTPVDDAELVHLHRLYGNIARKNLRINIFPLPLEVLRAHLESGTWEFVVVRRREGVRAPVAFGASLRAGEDYRWLYCGVDYEGFDVTVRSPYRQLLWQLIRRAGALGCRRIHLGMGSDVEKNRFGSVATPTFAWVRADDAYRATELQELILRLGLERR
ncbi:aminotransferase class I/II-fold pyridoxal phosphate-dependent enzyme [Polyangium aurulentum]|uniref:aminotransferase class I/II-fold pyridoxal phosphate-dependent enzyme n=1 Tax=Polyangium aurulentum TaxID=2567896 RepID=UPI0010AEC0C6|nr:aminotransferase class I/II-fold pyridoxal phosphate-dependent enzyme [Polyangium aurulentum]UQA62039.1 GNAT family N-acetyltransferase [Polyangium aurulentum]